MYVKDNKVKYTSLSSLNLPTIQKTYNRHIASNYMLKYEIDKKLANCGLYMFHIYGTITRDLTAQCAYVAIVNVSDRRDDGIQVPLDPINSVTYFDYVTFQPSYTQDENSWRAGFYSYTKDDNLDSTTLLQIDINVVAHPIY